MFLWSVLYGKQTFSSVCWPSKLLRGSDCRLFQTLKDNLAPLLSSKFFARPCLGDQSAGWWNSEHCLVSVSWRSFLPKLDFLSILLKFFSCTEIAVNDNRYLILKSHNMILLSFTGKTLPEELFLELCLQFSFCFFVRL